MDNLLVKAEVPYKVGDFIRVISPEDIKSNISSGKNPDIVIIGAPEYTGIARNGGRINKELPRLERGIEKLPEKYRNIAYQLINEGAPSTIRKRLYSSLINIKNIEKLKIEDWGNVQIDIDDIKKSQENIEEVVKYACCNGILPIIIGGGHNISLSTVSGLIESDLSKKYGILLVDAHTDYRELTDNYIHSGVPFRYLFNNYEDKIKTFVALGLREGKNQEREGKNQEEYIKGLESHGATLINLETINKDNKIIKNINNKFNKVDNYFLTIDIDAFDIRGASAPYTNGLSADIGKDIAFNCGKDKKCLGFDIVEVNPLIDLDSSELAANIIFEFISGFYER